MALFAFILNFSLGSNLLYAATLICSNRPVLVAKEDKNDFKVSDSIEKIDLSIKDIIDLFSYGRMVRNGVPVKLCVLPEANEATKEIFDEFGVSPNVIQSFLSRTNLLTHRVELVHSDQEMLACVANSYPAIGYVKNISKEYSSLECS